MSTKRVPREGTIARRAMLRTVGGTLAGAMVAGQAHGGQQHATHEASGDTVDPKPGDAAQGPANASESLLPGALDDHERATLAALGDQLVPGSSAAGAPALIDRLMAVEEPHTLRQFRNALGAFEREARRRHAKTWLELTEADRVAILERASTMPSSASEAAPATLRDHHDHLRGVVARVYYATEAGMKELGWTGLEFWDALPECQPERAAP